jgi:hypothetical protein
MAQSIDRRSGRNHAWIKDRRTRRERERERERGENVKRRRRFDRMQIEAAAGKVGGG